MILFRIHSACSAVGPVPLGILTCMSENSYAMTALFPVSRSYSPIAMSGRFVACSVVMSIPKFYVLNCMDHGKLIPSSACFRDSRDELTEIPRFLRGYPHFAKNFATPRILAADL